MTRTLPSTMKAVGFYKHLDITDPKSLQDITDIALPTVQKNEVLIEVAAVSVNPIDTKIRSPKGKTSDTLPTARILGWDGAGIIAAKGPNVDSLEVGDEVIFTGNIAKSGSNAQYVALNQIMVAPKPKNLTFEQAAAMPLTAVTAYEAIYDRMGLSEKDKGKSLLIINCAGGVGSVAAQLAKNLGMTVIGTASREESKAFALKFGADQVLNHSRNLVSELEHLGLKEVDYIMVNYDPYPYWDTLMHIIKPQGKICLVVDCSQPVDIRALKDKSITLVSEMMATRIKYSTPDVNRHNVILREVSRMLETGELKTTLTRVMSPINAHNLKDAHKLLESQKLIGKLVLKDF
ncbi:hypothetical protein O0L34_g5060 [Tuta absoluta]|nr:hypothetical protein O0L34_g5060 [Tuta absoluta]